MKILMILDHEFPPDIRVENEAQTLQSAGNEIHIACYTQKQKPVTDNYKGIIIHRKPISRLIYKSSVGCLRFPFYFNFWRVFVREILHLQKFDAIHVHDLPLAKVGWEFSKEFGIPLVLDLHENWPALLRISDHTNTFLGKLLSINSQWINYELKYCKNADKIIVVVEEAAHRLGNIGIDKKKILVVSNTLNTDSFKMPSTSPDSDFLTLFYAGGINRHRGLQYIIKGLKYVESYKKIRVWLLGSGSYVEELKKIASDEKVIDNVEFFGWKNFEEMNEMMGKADVCLIPHQKSDHTDTTIPHKLFQYMYAGKVIATSNCLPLARIVGETQSGIIYQWDNPKDFADKLTHLINSQGEIQKMTENGRQRVVEKYLWDFDSERLIEMYKSLMHG